MLICCAAVGCVAVFTSLADALPKLSVSRTNAALKLSWPGTRIAADGSTVRPYFELQRSPDLRLWQPIGERQRAAATEPAPSLGTTLTLDSPDTFYRLLSVEPPAVAQLGTGGAEVFGYGDAFTNALQRIGQISPDQFAVMFANSANYLPGISWDPTTAQYWDQFNADPNVVNQDKQPDQPGYRSFDARLSAPELALFKTNGFVVSERLGANSFAEVFYNLWHNEFENQLRRPACSSAQTRLTDALTPVTF
jgi:hypothetical protein